MRIRQLTSVITAALIIALSSMTFAQQQGYTPSDTVNAAIVDAQADGVITDTEAQALAQAMAADGASAAQVAGTLSNNVGASNTQVAAGLAAVGQTQGQIAAALTASGVVDNDADAAQAAQAGQQVAAASGNAVVVANTVTAAANANLTVTGSGLITDANGKAVIVKSPADQIFLIAAVIRNTANDQISETVAANLRAIVSSNPELAAVQTQLNAMISASVNGQLSESSSDEGVDSYVNRITSRLPSGTLTPQS